MHIKHESILSKKTNQSRDKFSFILTRNYNKFCKNTILHGLKYITDKKLYPRERLFFGLAFIAVIALAGVFIHDVWKKWSSTPVIFGTNPYVSYITREPFPAVTICNLNVAYKSKAEQYSIYSAEYAMLQMLCKRKVNVTIADSISDWNNLKNFMTEIAQPCRNMLKGCRFGSVVYNCSELFKPVITDEGLCCTFNKLHPAFLFKSKAKQYKIIKNTTEEDSMGGFVPVSWSSESGYQTNLPKYYQPRPAAGAGETLGLSLILDVELNEYYCSSMNSVGFKIMAHSPMMSPSVQENGLLLAPGSETKVLLTAEKYESEQKLRDIHYSYRQCFFQNEKDLLIFSQYSQSNCEIECFSKLLIQYCGCIMYFLPRLHGNESFCSIYDVTCVERMRISSKLAENNGIGCKEECLPSCHDINYSPKFFSAPLLYDEFHIINNAVKNMSSQDMEQNIVILHMYHRDITYRSYKQTVFFSGTDALSSIGGLISLFFGFGFISFAEFIYYAVIRVLREIRQLDASSKILPNEDNSNVEIKPDWMKPIRKRHRRHEIGLSPYRKIFKKQKHGSQEFFERKWYSKRHIIAGIDSGYLSNGKNC